MADEKVTLLVLGSPVISPKAPRKILKPSLDERIGARSLGRSPQPLNPWLLPKMSSSNQFVCLKLTRSKLEEEELVLLMEEEAEEEEEVFCLMEEEGEGVMWNGKGSSTCQR